MILLMLLFNVSFSFRKISIKSYLQLMIRKCFLNVGNYSFIHFPAVRRIKTYNDIETDCIAIECVISPITALKAARNTLAAIPIILVFMIVFSLDVSFTEFTSDKSLRIYNHHRFMQ